MSSEFKTIIEAAIGYGTATAIGPKIVGTIAVEAAVEEKPGIILPDPGPLP